jgi:hypothetical protein
LRPEVLVQGLWRAHLTSTPSIGIEQYKACHFKSIKVCIKKRTVRYSPSHAKSSIVLFGWLPLSFEKYPNKNKNKSTLPSGLHRQKERDLKEERIKDRDRNGIPG